MPSQLCCLQLKKQNTQHRDIFFYWNTVSGIRTSNQDEVQSRRRENIPLTRRPAGLIEVEGGRVESLSSGFLFNMCGYILILTKNTYER